MTDKAQQISQVILPIYRRMLEEQKAIRLAQIKRDASMIEALSSDRLVRVRED